MQTRVSKIEPLAVPAAEAARAVGLRTAAEFRSNFVAPGLVKRLRVSAELYSVVDLKRAVAVVSGAPAQAADQAFLAAEALRRVL